MSGAASDEALRRVYGEVLAALVRRLGAHHLEIAEDALQDATEAACARWADEPPEEPAAWLYRVAWRKALDRLRTAGRRAQLLAEAGAQAAAVGAPGPARLSGEVDDDLLRMLFACCDPALPEPAQLALALKTLCGLGVAEIAQLLFTSEAAIYKRLARARAALRATPPDLDGLTGPTLAPRGQAVRRIIYLVFTEGYLSNHGAYGLRPLLCREALRLGRSLAEHPVGAHPETYALVALMHLHAARLPGRAEADGSLVLLAEQDRARWDRREIAEGLAWLARAATGAVYSRYHAEAGIAAAHCLAPDLAQTRWDQVVHGYAQLERLAPSPLHTLNRALATAEWRGPAAGLAILEGAAPPSWLAGSYLWSAALGDLHGRCGHAAQASTHRARALADAPTPAVRAALTRRWASARSRR